MEIYRKDRLPEEQARFASVLGQKTVGGVVSTDAVTRRPIAVSPHNSLFGETGSCGGPIGSFLSPPHSSTPRSR